MLEARLKTEKLMTKESDAKSYIRVAVFMITYNHKKYVAQAIESVLQQRTSFNYQLFIGDDNSQDGTQEIASKYAVQFPNLINYTSNEHNLGAIANASKVLTSCTNSGAEYVAFLEGDDFWNDPTKLQQQVDFLDNNHDYSICFHDIQTIDTNFKPIDEVRFQRDISLYLIA